jgi:S-adenosylmethionine hydrolase
MITLLTDFGAADYFVPAVKGAILTIDSQALIVDITHEIIEHDIESAAFTLGACYRDFPAGTIHIAVVDPGVGSARRPIVIEAGGQLFVGPDNGIFSYIYTREPKLRVFHLNRSDLFRHPVSPTFHGRDIFAPVAAHLSKGMKPENLGDEIYDFVRFDLTEPQPLSFGRVRGCLIQVDRFGNCITNFPISDYPLDRQRPPKMMPVILIVAGKKIAQFGTHFTEAERKDELFAYPGSAGYWEIGLWCASAATAIDARRGMEVILEPQWI